MDPPSDLPELLEDYTANIDELTDALHPLLKTPLRTTASTLPLLDKAKLHILTAYAVESLLFSTLQASGADAKAHAVFPELARLKTYFAKVKQAEGMVAGGDAGDGSGGSRARLDKDAAARFIKHGLAGNERYDRERAEQMAKERARASAKAAMLNKKFNQEDEERRQAELAAQAKLKKAAAAEADADVDMHEDGDEQEEEEGDHVESENEEFYGPSSTTTPAQPQQQAPPPTSTKASTTHKKKPKKPSSEDDSLSSQTTRKSKPAKADKTERRAKKLAKRLEQQQQQQQQQEGEQQQQQTLLPTKTQQRVPKSHSQTFNALLNGSHAEAKGKKGKK